MLFISFQLSSNFWIDCDLRACGFKLEFVNSLKTQDKQKRFMQILCIFGEYQNTLGQLWSRKLLAIESLNFHPKKQHCRLQIIKFGVNYLHVPVMDTLFLLIYLKINYRHLEMWEKPKMLHHTIRYRLLPWLQFSNILANLPWLPQMSYRSKIKRDSFHKKIRKKICIFSQNISEERPKTWF